MEGSDYLRKGKRKLGVSDCGDEDDDDDCDELPEKKRQALAVSALFDADFKELLQNHLGTYLQNHLGTYLRRVVSEVVESAVERAISKLNLPCRCSAKQVEELSLRRLRLIFVSRLSHPLFTERKVEWENGTSIHVELFDAITGSIVKSGPESSVKLDVVVLEGDFNNGDDEDWSSIEFERHVINERKGRRPLLIGDLQVQLKEGVGTLGNLSFTDNSSWVPSKTFRFGLKVASNYCEGIRIREAKTEAFAVKDHRGELNRKHFPPALDDKIWRLKKIKENGRFCNSLNDNGIWTVRDFLRRLAVDLKKNLRETLGLPNNTWKALVDHARTCILNEKEHVYHLDDSRILLFNDIYGLKGLFANDHYYPVDFLSSNTKVLKVSVDDLLRKAYEDLGNIKERDGDAILDWKLNGVESQRTTDGTSSQQLFSQCLSIPVNPAQPMVEADFPSSSIKLNEIPTASNGMHSHTNVNLSLPIAGTSPPLQTEYWRNDSMAALVAGSPQLDIPIVVESGLNHNISEILPDGFSLSDIDQLLNGCDSLWAGTSFQQSYSQYDGPMSSTRKADKRWRKLGAILIWRFNIRRKIVKARQRLAPLMPVSVSS